MSSANNLLFEDIPDVKLLMGITNNNRRKMEPWNTSMFTLPKWNPTNLLVQVLDFYYLEQQAKRHKFLKMPYFYNLNVRCSSKGNSYAFDISKNIIQTSISKVRNTWTGKF